MPQSESGQKSGKAKYVKQSNKKTALQSILLELFLLVRVFPEVLSHFLFETLRRPRQELRHALDQFQNCHFVVHSRILLSLLGPLLPFIACLIKIGFWNQYQA